MLKKLLVSGCALAVLSWAAADVARAQLRGDKAVYFTFSEPVALPQMTLPAGKYLFRLADSLANRTIVQIYSADGSKLHGMTMTLPTHRADLPNEPEIRFLETAANEPPAIATYWYPGERDGWEFIYPRDQATRLARASKQSILTTTAQSDDLKTGELVRVNEAGEQTAVGAEARDVPVIGEARRGEIAADAPAPAASVAASASARTAPATVSAPASRPSVDPVPVAAAPARSTSVAMQDSPEPRPRAELPATASSTPTVVLVGLLSLMAAGVIGLWRRVQA
jgi:LPXTG-motif cell wall-anchored protein